MKIVIFTSLTKDVTANYLIRAFKNRGDYVFVFSDIPNVLADSLIEGCPNVSVLCNKFSLHPDLFLFIEGGSMLTFPVGLEQLECITAWYGIDTHMDYKKHLATTKLFDISFIAQYEYVQKLMSDGAKQVHWLPLGFEPSTKERHSHDRTLLISYIGSNNAEKHKERYELIKAITERYENIFFGRASPAEMSEIYAKSHMVFNKSINNDVNMRYFEAMGEGAVLITDKITNNGVEDLFVEGEHYMVYRDKGHLLEIIESLSKDKEKTARIGANARSVIIKFHTYHARTSQISEVIKYSRKIATPSPIQYFVIFIFLGLIPEAFSSLMAVLKSLETGKFNKIAVKLITPLLYFIFKFTQTLNYFRRKSSKKVDSEIIPSK